MCVCVSAFFYVYVLLSCSGFGWIPYLYLEQGFQHFTAARHTQYSNARFSSAKKAPLHYLMCLYSPTATYQAVAQWAYVAMARYVSLTALTTRRASSAFWTGRYDMQPLTPAERTTLGYPGMPKQPTMESSVWHTTATQR